MRDVRELDEREKDGGEEMTRRRGRGARWVQRKEVDKGKVGAHTRMGSRR